MERQKISEPLIRNRIFTIQDVAFGKTGRMSVRYQIEKNGELIDLEVPMDMVQSMAGLIKSICDDIAKCHKIREFGNTDGYTPDEVEKIYQDQIKKSKNCE